MKTVKKRDILSKQSRSLDFFKDITLFDNLSDKEISLFADVAQIKHYKKGQFLYMEGDQAAFFYIICSGWLKLLHVTEDGEEIIVAMITKNNITGESSIFEKGSFASSAQVVEDAEVLSIPLSILKEQLRLNNQLALNMLTSMTQYQRQHELQLQQYLLYSAPQRVGCFILGLCPVLEQKDGVILNLPYDKTLIASTLGMKGATFSRALNLLRDETGTRISGTRVTVASISRLLKFVDGCYLPHHLRKKLVSE
jgi:CRP/FNR family transcriptional regulator